MAIESLDSLFNNMAPLGAINRPFCQYLLIIVKDREKYQGDGRRIDNF